MRVALLVASVVAALSPLSAQAGPRAAPEATVAPGNTVGGGGKAFVAGWNIRQCEYARFQISGSTHSVTAFNTDGSWIRQSIASAALLAGQATLLNVCRSAAPYWVFCPTSACSWTALDTGGL